MLQVAICRLIQLWPDASIEVFTSAPDRLRKFCPGAKPLTINGHNIWFYPLIGRLHALLPSSLAEFWTDWEWKLRQYSPSTVRALLNLKTKPHALDYHALQMFTKALYRADLVVATGGGYINDEFPELASGILGVLGVASRLGKPTVMLGQGLGPLENPRLRTQAKQVFPRLNLMALRENYAGKKLLNSLGVAPKTLITTGDDAIESAYNKHHSNIGNAIGVNLRVASYSGVNT
ncbi:MAG: polysaccharide pyruvyl transferase family protein, partial [Leptolyngbyaceae cyanobacterium MO_188.B28]|nr:polysaccharide pyruvyl transferase family protein [Leptolyngbyaceae cyanobacterium MO_188.B28]